MRHPVTPCLEGQIEQLKATLGILAFVDNNGA